MNFLKTLGLNLKYLSRRSKPDAKLRPQWPEEPLDLSADQRGGFYPATLGNKLNSTYTIVRKLGWGQHSSVWLAKREGHVYSHSSSQLVVTHGLPYVPGIVDDTSGRTSQSKY
jgi:serine/threonine-protein kinase SRPK3